MNDNGLGLMGCSIQPDSYKVWNFFKWIWLQIFKPIKVWEFFLNFTLRYIWILFPPPCLLFPYLLGILLPAPELELVPVSQPSAAAWRYSPFDFQSTPIPLSLCCLWRHLVEHGATHQTAVMIPAKYLCSESKYHNLYPHDPNSRTSNKCWVSARI